MLTTQAVAKFTGGQMEIQNQGESYLYRGEVATIAVENNVLHVKFAWVARGEGFPPVPQKWVKHDRLDYAASLKIYDVSEIEDGHLSFNSPIVGELAFLFPPNGSKLDPSKVEGLQLAQA